MTITKKTHNPLFKAKVRSFTRRVLSWYDANGRTLPWRKRGEPLYRLVVSEILLQRTRAETVADFYDQFFSVFQSWDDLASAAVVEIGEVLKPIGLWKQRAPRLKGLAEAIVERGGELPRTRDELSQLPGLGQYVVNATLVFQGVEPAPLLDAGMARVLERHFGARKLADIRDDPYLQDLANEVVSREDCISVNWAILDLAALVCKKQGPRCQLCPVKDTCRAAVTRSDIFVAGYSKSR